MVVERVGGQRNFKIAVLEEILLSSMADVSLVGVGGGLLLCFARRRQRRKRGGQRGGSAPLNHH